MKSTSMFQTLADKINDHLAEGGVVQTTNHLHSTLYESQHTGWFTTNANGDTWVRQGKKQLCIAECSNGIHIYLLQVRFGRFAIQGESK